MVMLNDLDRFHLVIDVIDRVHWLRSSQAGLRQRMVDARLLAREYTREHGEDLPEVRDWVWPGAAGTGDAVAATVATGGDNE
jgi:xylulose-5-phosphate/fructose-6-phosphate phosphoketolase